MNGLSTLWNSLQESLGVHIPQLLGALLLGQERPSAGKLWGIGVAGLGAIYLVGPDRLSFAPGVAQA